MNEEKLSILTFENYLMYYDGKPPVNEYTNRLFADMINICLHRKKMENDGNE